MAMSPRAWVNALRDAVRSMTQSSLMSLASIATVAVSLLVLSVVLLLAVNLEKAARTAEQQVEIRAFLCASKDDSPTCPQQELQPDQKKAIVDQISKIPGVKQATFKTRDEALLEMRAKFKAHADILDGLDGENPLRDEVVVTAVEVVQVQGIAEAVLQVPGVAEATWGQDIVKQLTAFTHAVRIGGIGLVLLLIIATVLTISNTIRLAVYARRREISIMKLVGATDWYIRRPFMVEGIVLGVFGALLAMALAGYGYQRTIGYLDVNIPFMPLVRPEDVLMNLTVGLVALGGSLGAAGSLISMRRFLKV